LAQRKVDEGIVHEIFGREVIAAGTPARPWP
jgi:hypothetical protein